MRPTEDTRETGSRCSRGYGGVTVLSGCGLRSSSPLLCHGHQPPQGPHGLAVSHIEQDAQYVLAEVSAAPADAIAWPSVERPARMEVHEPPLRSVRGVGRGHDELRVRNGVAVQPDSASQTHEVDLSIPAPRILPRTLWNPVGAGRSHRFKLTALVQPPVLDRALLNGVRRHTGGTRAGPTGSCQT